MTSQSVKLMLHRFSGDTGESPRNKKRRPGGRREEEEVGVQPITTVNCS